MRVWLSRAAASGGEYNAVWVELGEERMLTIHEDGKHDVLGGGNARTVLKLLLSGQHDDDWERIA